MEVTEITPSVPEPVRSAQYVEVPDQQIEVQPTLSKVTYAPEQRLTELEADYIPKELSPYIRNDRLRVKQLATSFYADTGRQLTSEDMEAVLRREKQQKK